MYCMVSDVVLSSVLVSVWSACKLLSSCCNIVCISVKRSSSDCVSAETLEVIFVSELKRSLFVFVIFCNAMPSDISCSEIFISCC